MTWVKAIRRSTAVRYVYPAWKPIEYTCSYRWYLSLPAQRHYMETCITANGGSDPTVASVSYDYDDLLMSRRYQKRFTKPYVTWVMKSFGVKVV